MAFSHGDVSVDDTATKLVDGSEGAACLLTVDPEGETVYVGAEDVDTTTGFTLAPGGVLNVPLGARDDDLYGICESGLNTTVRKLVST